MDRILRIKELKFVPRVEHLIPVELLAKRIIMKYTKYGRESKTKD